MSWKAAARLFDRAWQTNDVMSFESEYSLFILLVPLSTIVLTLTKNSPRKSIDLLLNIYIGYRASRMSERICQL